MRRGVGEGAPADDEVRQRRHADVGGAPSVRPRRDDRDTIDLTVPLGEPGHAPVLVEEAHAGRHAGREPVNGLARRRVEPCEGVHASLAERRGRLPDGQRHPARHPDAPRRERALEEHVPPVGLHADAHHPTLEVGEPPDAAVGAHEEVQEHLVQVREGGERDRPTSVGRRAGERLERLVGRQEGEIELGASQEGDRVGRRGGRGEHRPALGDRRGQRACGRLPEADGRAIGAIDDEDEPPLPQDVPLPVRAVPGQERQSRRQSRGQEAPAARAPHGRAPSPRPQSPPRPAGGSNTSSGRIAVTTKFGVSTTLLMWRSTATLDST